MDRVVIISKKLRNIMPCEEYPHFPVLFTKDLMKEVHHQIERSSARPVFIFACIPGEEFAQALKILNSFSSSQMIYSLCICDTDCKGIPDTDKIDFISDFRTIAPSLHEFKFLCRKSFSRIEKAYRGRLDKDEFMIKLMDMKRDQEDLINIGRALSLEKDPDKLLKSILMLSKKITGADAGSIYLVEEPEPGKKQLRFKYSHTFSKEMALEEFVIPYDANSIAGYVAVTGNVLNVPDVYNLTPNDPVSFNSSFDKKHNYISKSMIAVPMRNHDDEIIGIIQLLNCKESIRELDKITGNEAFEIMLKTSEDFSNKVVPFEERYESLMEAVAGQAAIAIENNRMMKQIQHQFEEFVKASVSAIESRDPATSGHSFRVSSICRELALAINSENEGPFKNIEFSDVELMELKYACLLHDFGKVNIDLDIFMKGKKLYPKDYENIQLKLDYLYRYVELQYMIKKCNILKKLSDKSSQKQEIQSLEIRKKEMLTRVENAREIIQKLNEPTIIDKDTEELLRIIENDLEKIECYDTRGNRFEILTEMDMINLKIKRGTLNSKEREEIESHVMKTYQFVSKIPWPPEYKNIPDFALKHHEMIDGSGYPMGTKGTAEISIQARMIAIADIYDALTASDRPYKKALPISKALSIMEQEAHQNRLDSDLMNIFTKYKIYEI